MAASSLSLIFSTKLGQEIGICSNMGRKDNRTPQGAFERQRCMNVVVHKARNPQLNEYIHSAVNGILPVISKVGDNGTLLVPALMLIPAKMQRCGFQQMQSSGSNHHL